ncbi:MAG: hypothetical protein ACTH0V_00190 [Microbacteriaceae bacterium]
MNVDLNSGWSNFLSVVDPSGGIRTVLGIAGVAIAVFFLIKWIWEKRTGRSGGGGFPIWMMIFAAILAAPSVLIPILLTIVGWIIGIIANIAEALAQRGGA